MAITVCPYCGCGCVLELKVEKGKIASTMPVKDDPVSEGKPCIKGLTVHEAIYSKDRIKKPMIRANGKLKETTWEKAYDYIHKKLNNIKPDEIAFYASSPATNEDCFIFQKFARECFKTDNIDSCARLCHASTVYALEKAFGIGAMPHAMLKDLKKADCILIVGSNPASNYPVAFDKMKAGGTKIICLKQLADETTKRSDLLVKVSPASQLVFLNCILNLLVQKKAVKVPENLKMSLMKYTREKTAEICKVKIGDIEKVADYIEKSKYFCLEYGMSLTQHTYGIQNVLAAANLVIAKNGRIIPMRGKANIQGVGDMGCQPEKGGSTIIGSTFLYPVKALWVMETNPAQSMPDLNKLHKLMKKMFIVQQTSYPNLTTRFANVVLPACTWAEREGSFTNAESRVRLVRKIINPLRESKPHWKIIIEAAKKFGLEYKYNSPFELWNGIKKKAKGYDIIDVKKLKAGKSQFVKRKIKFKKFHVVDFKGFEEYTSKEYPFILSTARRPYNFCTSEMTSRSKRLHKLQPEARCRISIEDAKKLKLRDEGKVVVKSRAGELKIKVKITKDVPKGLVIIPFHFEHALVNKLFPLEFNEKIEEPNLKRVAVSVKKIR